MRLGGQLIDDVRLNSLVPPYSSLCVGEGVHILIDPAHPVRYGNHSCDPNLWHEDATTIVARRPISAGEELTLDYATHTISPKWSMPCHCGSPLCRKLVSGNDWKLADLQSRYGHHWTPPLYAAIVATQTVTS
ncbi:MAG: SET domain-containing protein-lysine N-methyltransferase [Cytophagaceae bacterium]|nr:MAG: SET domain-containing protein-lysine N-methyltransferase [Cytophagaceae bacterium]